MPIQYRFVITAQDEGAFFADPDQACADIKRLLVERAVHLVRPEQLADRVNTPAFELTDLTDVELPDIPAALADHTHVDPAALEGQPDNPLPSVNGTKVFLALVIQRDRPHKLRG